jgi:hypothetical protein
MENRKYRFSKQIIHLLAVLLAFMGLGCTAGAGAKKYQVVEISTDLGNIYIWLYEETPRHRENFLKLSKEGFYNGTVFHRVIKDFMIQGETLTAARMVISWRSGKVVRVILYRLKFFLSFTIKREPWLLPGWVML